MKLLTKAIEKQLPPLYTTDGDADAMVIVKFFTPWANWTWYATEYDGEDKFFGYVVGMESELGYFSLAELKGVKGPFRMKIERDRLWSPVPLSEVKSGSVR